MFDCVNWKWKCVLERKKFIIFSGQYGFEPMRLHNLQRFEHTGQFSRECKPDINWYGSGLSFNRRIQSKRVAAQSDSRPNPTRHLAVVSRGKERKRCGGSLPCTDELVFLRDQRSNLTHSSPLYPSPRSVATSAYMCSVRTHLLVWFRFFCFLINDF